MEFGAPFFIPGLTQTAEATSRRVYSDGREAVPVSSNWVVMQVLPINGVVRRLGRHRPEIREVRCKEEAPPGERAGLPRKDRHGVTGYCQDDHATS